MKQMVNISISLIRIPRLFLSLFLVPICLSIFIVFVQLIIVSLVIHATNRSSGDTSAQLERTEAKEGFVRQMLLGQSAPFEELTVCRWIPKVLESGEVVEVPPSDVGCEPDRLDVAIRSKDTQKFNVEPFVKYIKGNSERLHVCSTCQPDLVIETSGAQVSLHAHSLVAAFIIPLLYEHDELQKVVLEVNSTFDEIATTFGSVYIHLPGFSDAISIDEAKSHVGLIINTITILLIALWLTIKAHRNVLDYFARNGALLPMVASVGTKEFYSAIWFLTLFRVSIFLIAAVPLTFLFAYADNLTDFQDGLFTASTIPDVVWIASLAIGLGLAAIISSIGELQHRHYIFSFVYKYVSLFICIFGALLWLCTFLVSHDVALTFRAILGSLPVVGLTPVLVSPILRPSLTVLILHAVLSLSLIVLILKYNQRWFAAHLEEL